LFAITQKYQAFYVKTEAHFIVAADIKLPY